MPILGVIASSTRQGQATDTGAMFPISTISVGSAGAANVLFSNIPSTYKHLQVRIMARTTRPTGVNDYMDVILNGDTNANYTYHYIEGDGTSTLTTGYVANNTKLYSSYIANAGTSNANIFGVNIVDIPDYANTSKSKTVRFLGGNDQNGNSGKIAMMSGAWMSNNAITSIQFTPSTGNFVNYSQFVLYGIKTA